MFVINDFYGKNTGSFINGEAISIGSFKNNFEKKNNQAKIKRNMFYLKL